MGRGLWGRGCGAGAAERGSGVGTAHGQASLGFAAGTGIQVCVCLLRRRQLSEGGISEEILSCTPTESVAHRLGLGMAREPIRNAEALERKGSSTVPQCVCGRIRVCGLIFLPQVLPSPRRALAVLHPEKTLTPPYTQARGPQLGPLPRPCLCVISILPAGP